MTYSAQSIAVIPAAGRSVRMGTAKLMLPWRGRPLMAHVIDAWQQSRVNRLVVVARRDDRPLVEFLQNQDVLLVLPEVPPPQMRDSVQVALDCISEQFVLRADDSWLLAPADLPQLSPQVINRVVTARPPERDAIVVPLVGGRRGHPVRFPWSLHSTVARLGPDQGINVLLQQYPVHEIVCSRVPRELDIDHPEDYRRLQSEPSPDGLDSHPPATPEVRKPTD